MPTYDYLCEKGHRFELFQSMKDDAVTECKECGGPVKRLIGAGAGFLFKGDGFYITENRSKEYKKKASADSAASSGSSTDKSAKSSSDTTSKSKDKGSSSGSKGSKD
jgi:putative FmdB family regulatory protein